MSIAFGAKIPDSVNFDEPFQARAYKCLGGPLDGKLYAVPNENKGIVMSRGHQAKNELFVGYRRHDFWVGGLGLRFWVWQELTLDELRPILLVEFANLQTATTC